jgi:hypothetical protein
MGQSTPSIGTGGRRPKMRLGGGTIDGVDWNGNDRP